MSQFDQKQEKKMRSDLATYLKSGVYTLEGAVCKVIADYGVFRISKGEHTKFTSDLMVCYNALLGDRGRHTYM